MENYDYMRFYRLTRFYSSGETTHQELEELLELAKSYPGNWSLKDEQIAELKLYLSSN